MRLLLILMAAAAVYAAIWTMGKHGLVPGSQDFWVCLVSPFAAGAMTFLAPTLKKKAKT